MARVAIRELEVSFGSLKVLQDLDIAIDAGEFIVLLGPSGCGKSTLLNAIAGLLDVSAGQVWIDGRNVTWEEPKDRGIGMVFQSYALYPRMTVEGNLSFGLKMAGVPKGEIARRINAAAELLHIDSLMKRRPSELSGGQRQRVAIGRALVRDVSVFLFDEPLSNLDAALRTELRVELKRLHRELGGSTMIYVTHDQVEALTLADRIAVMHGGIIQQLDKPRTKCPITPDYEDFDPARIVQFYVLHPPCKIGCPTSSCAVCRWSPVTSVNYNHDSQSLPASPARRIVHRHANALSSPYNLGY